jgi:hypothetical protein
MLVTAEDARSPENDQDSASPQPSDVYVSDTGMQPLCGEDEFTAIMEEMVADEAPRLFAVVQVYGERVDARIAGWGMAFADHAEVVSVERTQRITLQAPENALLIFTYGTHVRTRLVWLNADAAITARDAAERGLVMQTVSAPTSSDGDANDHHGPDRLGRCRWWRDCRPTGLPPAPGAQRRSDRAPHGDGAAAMTPTDLTEFGERLYVKGFRPLRMSPTTGVLVGTRL